MTDGREPRVTVRLGRILALFGELLEELSRETVATPIESQDGSAGEPEEGAPAEPASGAARPPASAIAGEQPSRGALILVCEGPEGEVALPWSRVAGLKLDAQGAPQSLLLRGAGGVSSLDALRVTGLWTVEELFERQGQLRWLPTTGGAAREGSEGIADGTGGGLPEGVAGGLLEGLPEGLPEGVAGGLPEEKPEAILEWTHEASPELTPEASPGESPGAMPDAIVEWTPEASPAGASEAAPEAISAGVLEGVPVPLPSVPVEITEAEHTPPEPPAVREQPTAVRIERAAAPETGGGAESPPADRRVWIVSPSALARRFLMRHLTEMGLEVREARVIEDPLLPADLSGVGGLFLDESLLESWQAHPIAARETPPLVLLTVDGVLNVPPPGLRPRQGAALPRPFERSEVERVVGWLRSLWEDTGVRGSDDHGNAEDDTWLFADPFGATGAGEHPGR